MTTRLVVARVTPNGPHMHPLIGRPDRGRCGCRRSRANGAPRSNTGQVNERRDDRWEIDRRSARSRRILGLRALALVCSSAALVVNHASLRGLLIAAAAGLLLVLIAWRRKAPVAVGTLWTASADLMHGAAKFPGQLCLTPESVAWTPSSYARRHGESEMSVQLTGDTSVSFEAGPSLLDVLITVHLANGEQARFLTHRSPRLRRTIRQISPA